MSGRQGQGNGSWERLTGEPLTSSNGTGKQRALPRRPSNMTRLDHPPQTPRVGRPQRPAPPKRRGRRLVVLGLIFLVCGLLAWLIGYALVNFFIGIGASAGASNTASSFLSDLSTQDYDQAYKLLDASITLKISPDAFRAQALQADACHGKVTNFSEVGGSATISADGNTQGFTYTITRSKGVTYPLHLTLHKDSYGNWYITSYGSGSGDNDLAPGLPTCS